MSYETQQTDDAEASQRTADTNIYTSLENDVTNITNQVTSWHASAQALADVSTQDPSDTTDLNTLRTNLESALAAILTVVIT